MSTFQLRPVSQLPPSPTSTMSTVRSPTPGTKVPMSPSSSLHPRRPLSPSTLRDVNLTPDSQNVTRNYPAPPTGHELMALFPTPPPPTVHEAVMPGPTSRYFQRQERAFFSQTEMNARKGKAREPVATPRSNVFHQPASSHLPPSSSHPPHPHHHQYPTALAVPSVAPNGIPAPFAIAPHTTYPAPAPLPAPPRNHLLHTPPYDTHSSTPVPAGMPASAEDFLDNPDEAWRQPMPHSERRRAGKHTKRIVVRT